MGTSWAQWWFLALVFALPMSAADLPVPWHHPLCLANHGYWPLRLPVVTTNESAPAVAGEPAIVPATALAGQRVDSLRVCQADGVELLFDVIDATNSAKHRGNLATDDRILVLVPGGAESSTAFLIYSGNDAALPVMDWLGTNLLSRAVKSSRRVLPAPVERLVLKQEPLPTPDFRADWPVHAIVRVFNVTDRVVGPGLIASDLRPTLGRWLKTPGHAAARVVNPLTDETEPTCLRQQDQLYFLGVLPPRSLCDFVVELNPARQDEEGPLLKDHTAIMNNPSNLAPGGDFDGAASLLAHWSFSGDAGKCEAGLTNDSRFGRPALHFTVPTNMPVNWIGWRSTEIPVRPGATYLYSGYLKARNLEGTTALHAHWHTKDLKMTATSAFVGTSPTVTGDAAWTQSSAIVQAPPDAAFIQLHLTMNSHGTLQHDGIVFCEVVRGEVVRLDTAESASPIHDLRVAAVNPLIKVFPDDPPAPAAASVTLECARNEYEPIQLVARSSFSQRDLEVTVSPLRQANGSTLPAVKVEQVGYVPVDHPSGYYVTQVEEGQRKLPHGSGATDGWAGEWPDPLLPAKPMQLAANRNQPFWLTVHAPRETAAGEYHGEINFRSAGANQVTLPLTVKVLPFALPETTSLRVIFDFRFGPGGSFGSGGMSERGRRQWLRFIAEHRLGINGITPAPVFSFNNGRVAMDTAGFDEAARFCLDELGLSVSYTPEFFYMFGWAYPPKKLFGFEPLTPPWNDAFKQAYRLFSDHLRQKGWHDRFVFYISDEPHFQHEFVVEQMRKLCALAHEVDPKLPIYSSTWRHCRAWDDSLDIWGVGQHGSFPVAEMAQLRKAGRQFWFTCDGQMATDTPYLATERLLPYYCRKYGVSGFEFWGLAWWTYDPWKAGWHTFIRQSDEGKNHYWIRYPNGDGFLAYPGSAVGVDGPVSTIRLEQVREGLEDYEAMAMLAELVEKAKKSGRPAGAGERALALAGELVLIPNAGGLRSTDILSDPDRIPAIRKAVNAALVELMR